ncbi:MAG: CCA tRNA nucleotidyltransferase [Bacteroidota bacterium]
MRAPAKITPSHPTLDLSVIPPVTLGLLRSVSFAASLAGIPAYLAGGFVRDLLIGRTVNDFDVVVEGHAIRLARSLAKAHGGRVTAHPKFGTATWTLPPELVSEERPLHSLDLATARRERYRHPGDLPEVEFATIQEDLGRRDFSFNAMALRLDGEGLTDLLDPFGGQKDLERGRVRVLHSRSFIDDPTRMFRALRYAYRYGFEIAPATRRLFNEQARQVLSRLSGERIRHEFDLILEERNSAAILVEAAELGLLSAVDPMLPHLGLELAGLRDTPPDPAFGLDASRRILGYLLWLMHLSRHDLLRLRDRLALSAEVAKPLLAAAALWQDIDALGGARPSRWVTRLDRVPPIAIYAVYLRTREPALSAYLERWRDIRPYTTGEDLKQRGLEAGPRYKEILSRLRAAWLDGEIGSKPEESALLDILLKEE